MRISGGVLVKWGILRGAVAPYPATIFASAGFSQTRSPRVHLHSQRH
jgi:hypothetical protein